MRSYRLCSSRLIENQVIVYSQTDSFGLIESDIQLAQSQPDLECRLYPLLNRVMSDICIVAKCKSTSQIRLQCHNQALFAVPQSSRFRVPDCAACAYVYLILNLSS